MRIFPPGGRDLPPLDYTNARQSISSEPGPVDIVVPVHGAHAEFERCLASIVAQTDLTRHRLIVVLDGPGQDRARAAVERAGPGRALVLLENPSVAGFVASVNRAIQLSSHDVVLLNSDTVVTKGWVDQLQSAAFSSSGIATATPFSNNGSICSIPLPSELDVDAFAALVTACSRRVYPRLPTGVGFCLFIKRGALDAVGLFDETAFGRGYGEEVDFCLRAVLAGYVHVLDDATFIYHSGGRSFGPRMTELRQAGLNKVVERHPEYFTTMSAFYRSDELSLPRQYILMAVGNRGQSIARTI